MRDINGSKPTSFPLDEEKLSFKIPCPDRPPREKILKLGSMITNRIGLKATADDPEYWGLDALVTDEMADVALKMGVRKPKTLEQLMKLTKMEREPLQKLLDEMAWLGLIEYNWENLDGKNPNHEKRYILPLFVPGSAEFLNMRRSQIDAHPEVAAFFERMTMLPLEKITPMVPPGGAGIGMHVIPVEKAIETEQEAIGLEKISYWLHKYEGKYAKSMCSCRASRDKLGEGCGDDPENWCIAVGDMADYVVETQRGEYITKEEALDIFRRAEENGFVHQITNIDGEQKIFAICNCNVNICNALRTSQLFNTPNMSRSAYVAKVESENCVACGRCVEGCPAGAVKLGQKLCTKDGPITYPRQELPDYHEWRPEKWAIDYRDKNRVNCYKTGTAPCKTACPAHIAVQGYLKLAAQGKYKEALQLIKRDNPFPAVCGRICNRRCEDACTRGTIDQAVAIDEVKRFIAQQDLNAETRFVPEKVIPKVDGEFEEKIAIIGGGPAGLSCAYYLAEKGYRPTVFEKEQRLGGMLENGLPSFRLEKDVVQAEIDVLREMGVQFRCGVEVGKDVTIAQLRQEGFRGFYVAVGLQSGGKLDIAERAWYLIAEGSWALLSYQPPGGIPPVLVPFPLPQKVVILPFGRQKRIKLTLCNKIVAKQSEKFNISLLKNVVDCDKIIGNSVLRTRRPGDRIRTAKTGKPLPLGEAWAAAGIPAPLRPALAVLADDNGVLWAEGLSSDSRAAVTEKTGQYVIIECQEEKTP